MNYARGHNFPPRMSNGVLAAVGSLRKPTFAEIAN